MQLPKYTKQELCDALYAAVGRAEKPLSRLEICRAIGRAKSPHILKMIANLAVGGWIVEAASVDKFGRKLFVYTIGKQADPNCDQAA